MCVCVFIYIYLVRIGGEGHDQVSDRFGVLGRELRVGSPPVSCTSSCRPIAPLPPLPLPAFPPLRDLGRV